MPRAAKSTSQPSISREMLPPTKDRLIVALDVPQADAALSLVERLDGACRWFKVGLELYLAAGEAIVTELRRRGLSVFLDLKFHDIPNTVAAAVRTAERLGVGMLTVHAGGGPAMLRAAAEAAGESAAAPLLLAVTVLTSMDSAELSSIGIEAPPIVQAQRLAKMASACGIHGYVCSAQEAAALRSGLGRQAVLVTPGIRPHGEDTGDQKRVTTPADAIDAGADYLVVGRPITRAADPAAAARAILSEIEAASSL